MPRCMECKKREFLQYWRPFLICKHKDDPVDCEVDCELMITSIFTTLCTLIQERTDVCADCHGYDPSGMVKKGIFLSLKQRVKIRGVKG